MPPLKLMLGPGPSTMHHRTYDALSRPIMSFDDPEFHSIIDNVCKNLKILFNTNNTYTFPIAGSGTYGMEFLLRNIITKDDHVLVVSDGYFGDRMCAMAELMSDKVYSTVTVTPEALTNYIKKMPMPPAVVCIVHAETSNLKLNNVKEIVEACRKYNNPIIIMDAVSSLGGVPVKIDEWGIDACFSATQKCISAPPGLALITMNGRFIQRSNAKTGTFCFSIPNHFNYWAPNAHKYFYTVPINLIYALDTALTIMLEEGLDAVHKRHADVGQYSQIELKSIAMTVDICSRIPYMNAVTKIGPNDDLKQLLLETYGIQIGGALSTDYFRVGLMGESARMENVDKLITAIRCVRT